MNKKFLALIITLAALQPGTSLCMFGKGCISDPDELFDNYVKPYVNPIDQEKKELEEEFNKLWDRVEKLSYKNNKSGRLNKQDTKRLAVIFNKITPEKNPEVIKKLKEYQLVEEVLFDAITHGITSVIKNFIGNTALFDAIAGKNKATYLEKSLAEAVRVKQVELIEYFIKLGANVKNDVLITLLLNKNAANGYTTQITSFSTGKFDKGSSFFDFEQNNPVTMVDLLNATKILVKSGADVNSSYDNTPVLRLALREFYLSNTSDKDYALSAIELIKFLLEKGADPEAAGWHRIFTKLQTYSSTTEDDIKKATAIRNVTLPMLIDVLAHFKNIPWSTIIKESDLSVFIRAVIRLGKPDVVKQIYDRTDDLRKEEKNKIYTFINPIQEWVKALENAKDPLNFFFKYLAEEALKLAKETKNKQEKELYFKRTMIFLRAALSEKGRNPAEIETLIHKNKDFYEFCIGDGKNHWNFDLIGYKNNLKDLSDTLTTSTVAIMTVVDAAKKEAESLKKLLDDGDEIVTDGAAELLDDSFEKAHDKLQNLLRLEKFTDLLPYATIGIIKTTNDGPSKVFVRPDIKIYLADPNQD